MLRYLVPALLLVFLASGCPSTDQGSNPQIVQVNFAPQAAGDVLTPAEVQAILTGAINSIDTTAAGVTMAVAVTDRIGNILGIYNSAGNGLAAPENAIATSVARATSFLSHSQAPLTSRTGQFLNTFHFPPAFAPTIFDPADPSYAAAPERRTIGITNTSQGPLWEIARTNRGSVFGPFNAGLALPQSLNPDGSAPSPGLTPLPGGLSLYKTVAGSGNQNCVIGLATNVANAVNSRCVGGVGVYVFQGNPLTNPLPEVAEFVSVVAASAPPPVPNTDPNFLFPCLNNGQLSTNGGVFLNGILLPAVEQITLPVGFNAGPPAVLGTTTLLAAAQPDPFGNLIGPLPSTAPGGIGLTAAEVQAIVNGCIAASQQTHAAIRLPPTSPCKMIITVTDFNGDILGAFREEDATLFSFEVSLTKARNAYTFSQCGPGGPCPNGLAASVDIAGPNVGNHPLFPVFQNDPNAMNALNSTGIALTARSLGFLSQPFFPPTIDNSGVQGPLFPLVVRNRTAAGFNASGFTSTINAANNSGIVFFPGSAPLYKNGVLVGGLGVSGDGVEQDDYVTSLGITIAEQNLNMDLEPPPNIRIDNFQFSGVQIPYMKFPQNPGG